MITIDRNGNKLDFTDFNNSLSTNVFNISFRMRLIDMNGYPLDETKWIYYNIAANAFTPPQRSGYYDKGAMSLKFSFYSALLPSNLIVNRYMRIEMDIVYTDTAYPYFTGILDSVQVNSVETANAIIDMLSIECFGNLQRCKGYPLVQLTIQPYVMSPSPSIPLTAYCIQQTAIFTAVNAGVIGHTDVVPLLSFKLNSSSYCTFTNLTNGARTPVFSTDYSINDATYPNITITWNTTLVLASDVIKVTYYVAQYYAYSYPYLYGTSLPYTSLSFGPNRDYRDTYDTYVVSTGVGGTYILPADTTFISTYVSSGLAPVEAVPEAIAIVHSDMSEDIVQVIAISTTLGFQVSSIPAKTKPGDSLRVCTTQIAKSWGVLASANFQDYQFYYAGPTYYTRHAFKVDVVNGVAIPYIPTGAHTVSCNNIFYVIKEAQNDVAQVLYSALLNLQMYNAADIIYTLMFVYVVKNYFTDTTLDNFLIDYKKNLLPPNGFVFDDINGKIYITTSRQKLTYDWSILKYKNFQQQNNPEPVTGVCVKVPNTKVEVQNRLFYKAINFANPAYLYDGSTSVSTVLSNTASKGTIIFKIPNYTPEEIAPMIDSVEIFGTAYITAYVAQINSSDTITLQGNIPNATDIPIGAVSGSAGGSYSISGKDIEYALFTNGIDVTSNTAYIIIDYMDDDTIPASPIHPIATEVKILMVNKNAFTAKLTDVAANTIVPSNQKQLGSVFVQPDTTKKISYIWGNPAYLKRVQPHYLNKKYRIKSITLNTIGLHDCRSYAENYLLALQAQNVIYKVDAFLVPWAQYGDTVRVVLNNGTTILLLLQGWEDKGDGRAVYQLVNYAVVTA